MNLVYDRKTRLYAENNRTEFNCMRLKSKQLIRKECARGIVLWTLTTDSHETSRGLSARASCRTSFWGSVTSINALTLIVTSSRFLATSSARLNRITWRSALAPNILSLSCSTDTNISLRKNSQYKKIRSFIYVGHRLRCLTPYCYIWYSEEGSGVGRLRPVPSSLYQM